MSLRALSDGLRLHGIDVSHVTVQRLETGGGLWTDERMRAVARYFGLMPQQFVAMAEMENGSHTAERSATG